MRAESRRGLEATYVRHLKIHDYHVERLPLVGGDGLTAVANQEH